MQALDRVLQSLNLKAYVFHNGQYCGVWAIDTSGTKRMTFHVVVKGSCYLHLADGVRVLHTGDAVFFPHDQKHVLSSKQEVNGDTALNSAHSRPMTHKIGAGTGLICGYFCHDHPLFNQIAASLPEYIVVESASGGAGGTASSNASSQLLQLLLAESKNVQGADNVLLNRLSDCLVLLLLRDHLPEESGLLSALLHPQLRRSFDMIHDREDRAPNLQQLAEAAHMSQTAYSKLFKSLTKMTPGQYIVQSKMANAYRWLADEGLTTLEAALRCGYEGEASFAKAFKRVLGFGPGKARAMSAETRRSLARMSQWN